MAEDSASPTTETADRIAMIEACKSGDAARVRALLGANPGLAEFDNPIGRFAPLHYAARAGHAAVVAALLEAGATPNPYEHMLRNHCGTTTTELVRLRGFTDVAALLDAAIAQKHHGQAPESEIRAALKSRDLARVADLVRHEPALVGATDDDGNTPLHLAADLAAPDFALFDLLLNNGADQQATNALGMKPVHLTLFRNHEWTTARARWIMTGYLLARGAEYNICIAAAAGDEAFVGAELKRDPALANYQDTCLKRPLSCAAEFGHFAIVRLLLEHGADPNAQEGSPFKTYPLVAAVDHNNLEAVRILLQHGASPDAYVDAGGNALYHALDRGYRDIADELAAHGASISASDYAWRCDLPVLSALLKANPALAPELLAYNDESKPEKSMEVVKMAFKNGADPGQVGNWTLYRACSTPALLKAFLDAGVDPNTADKEGKTTLHAMNRFPNIECAGLLLDAGANINARDDVHFATPLGWAALFGNKEMTEYLLSRGAQPNLPDDEPWSTPLFWARQRGHAEIAAMLEQHGATR